MAFNDSELRKRLIPKILFLFFGVIVGIFLYRGLVIKTQEKIKQTKGKLTIAEGEMKRNKMMVNEVEDFEKKQLEIESKVLRFKELIPHVIDTTKIVKLLEELSSEYKFKEMKVDILPLVESKESYFCRRFRIYLQAKYAELANFFIALKDPKYLINLEELEIKRNTRFIPYLEVTCTISTIQSSSEE